MNQPAVPRRPHGDVTDRGPFSNRAHPKLTPVWIRGIKIVVTFGSLAFIVMVIPWRDRAKTRDLGTVVVFEDHGASLSVISDRASSMVPHVMDRSQITVIEPGMASLLANVNPVCVIGYFACMLAIAILLASRWRLLLLTDASVRPSLAWSIVNWGQSQVISALPTSQFGGDIFRMQRTTGLGHGWGTACAIIALERLCGLAALCAVAVVGLICSRLISTTHLIVTGLALCAVCVVTIKLRDTISTLRQRTIAYMTCRLPPFCVSLCEGLANVVGTLNHNCRLLIVTFLLSVAAQVLSPLSFVFVDRALGMDTPVWCYLVAVPALAVAQYLPVHIAGIGLVEGGLWLTLSHWAGRSAAEVVALSAGCRILGILWLAVLTGSFAVRLRSRPHGGHRLNRLENLPSCLGL